MFYLMKRGGGSEPLDSVGDMSKSGILRGIITEKLSTAAREILAVVERTVADCEEEAAVFRREIGRQRRQLELLQPRVKLERRDLDMHEMVVIGDDEEQQQHTHLLELTPDLHGHEVVMEARQEEQHTQQPEVEDTGSPGLLLYSENHFEDEEVEMSSVQPEMNSTQNGEHLKEPDHQIPARSFSPKVQSGGKNPRRGLATHLDFRIRILEDCPGNMLSNSVFQNCPVQHLKCPRDLPEADFLDLLRSTFPRLANEEHIHFFKSSTNRLLQRLEVKSLTPEEIYQALRSTGNSSLYIRLKFEGMKPSKPLISDTQTALQFRIRILEDSQTDMLSNLVFKKCPVQDMTCPRSLQEEDFLELLRSTFPQLPTDEPLDFFISSTDRKLQPLKVDPRTPEKIYKAIKACGNSALYIRPKNKDGSRSSSAASSDQTKDSKRRDSSKPLTTLDFRIRILEDSEIDVLSNVVFEKCPLHHLRCPHGLQEEGFLELLKSTFPQLPTDEPLDFFISSTDRKLRPLKVDPRTPEEIYKAIKAWGNSTLYIRPKVGKEEEEALHCLLSSDAEAKGSESAGLCSSSPVQPVDGTGVEVLPGRSTSEKQDPQADEEAADSEMDSSDGLNGDEAIDGDGDWEPDSRPQTPKKKKKQLAKRCVKRLQSKKPCKVCGVGYSLLGSLIKHAWSHVDEPQSVCGICGKSFDSVEALRGHIGNYQKTHNCSVCGKSFTSKDSLRKHVTCHTGNMPFKCNICNKAFSRRSGLMNHRWVHVEEKPHRCDLCPRLFAFKSQLTAHTKNHTCKEQYHCNICGRSVYDRRSLFRHKLTHSEERPYCCHVCGKRFKIHESLKQHEQIHTVREKPYLCDVCCKTFTSNNILRVHMRTHSTERPFICDTCNKGFGVKADLRKHMRVHTGEAPYGCSICGRFFKQRSALNSHVRGHSGIKRYVCEICGKASARNAHLKIHMRTHNGERPYKCTLCEKAFTQSHCLKSHMKTHEPEEESPIPSQPTPPKEGQ